MRLGIRWLCYVRGSGIFRRRWIHMSSDYSQVNESVYLPALFCPFLLIYLFIRRSSVQLGVIVSLSFSLVGWILLGICSYVHTLESFLVPERKPKQPLTYRCFVVIVAVEHRLWARTDGCQETNYCFSIYGKHNKSISVEGNTWNLWSTINRAHRPGNKGPIF